jgi:hypothetical protein
LGDQQPQEVVHEKGVGIDEATASPRGDILIEAVLQQFGLALRENTNDMDVGAAGSS